MSQWAPVLGAIVEDLQRPGVAEAVLVEAGELALLSRMGEAARALDTSVGELAGFIAKSWLAQAADEDWLRLFSVIGRSDNPGLAALVMMLEQALQELDRKDPGLQPAGAADEHH